MNQTEQRRDVEQFAHERNSDLFRGICVPPTEFFSAMTPGVTHRIVTRGIPTFARPRCLAPDKKEALRQELGQLLKQGILFPSLSP